VKPSFEPISRPISDPRAPERLRGHLLTAQLDPVENTLMFYCDVPDDATAQELGYLRWFVGEFVDTLKEQFPDVNFGDMNSWTEPL